MYKEQATSLWHSASSWCSKRDVDLDSIWPKLEPLLENLAEAFVIDVLDFIASFVLVLIFTVYLLLCKHDYPPGGLRDRINFQIQRYIFLKAMICLLEGVIVGIVFWLLGADLAFFWGFVTFLCNWVPNIGR